MHIPGILWVSRQQATTFCDQLSIALLWVFPSLVCKKKIFLTCLLQKICVGCKLIHRLLLLRMKPKLQDLL